MPLPVIHAFAGYQIYKLSLSEDEKKSWKMAATCMVLANFADIDMLPGMFFGNPDMFHRSVTHSLGAAIITSAAAACVAWIWSRRKVAKAFLVGLNAYFSHVVLDYITGSVRFMLWPFKMELKPLTITQLFNHHHLPIDCKGLTDLCALLISPTLTIRLFAEFVLVLFLIKITRLFSQSRAIQPGISESPLFIASLTIFIFVITALLTAQAAI